VSIVFHLLTHFHEAFPRRKVPFVYHCAYGKPRPKLWQTSRNQWGHNCTRHAY